MNAKLKLLILALACTASGMLHASSSSLVSGFGTGDIGEDGWKADDVRDSTGANLIGENYTHAPAGAWNEGDDALIANQIFWRTLDGSRGGLGGVSFTGTDAVGGKSTLSIIEPGDTGFGAVSDLLDEYFRAEYRFKKETALTPGVGFKIGIQSTAWGIDAGQSQEGFSAIRSGEPVWDLLLVYDPSINGAGAGTEDFFTQRIDYENGIWNLFAQASNGNWIEIAGSNPPGVGTQNAKTLAGWAEDEVWGQYLFGEDAVVMSVQFGMGSGNEGATAVLDYTMVSFLNDGMTIHFIDENHTIWTGSEDINFLNPANWSNGLPDSDTNAIIDSGIAFDPLTGDIDTRSFAVLSDYALLDLNSNVLTLHNGGHLFVDGAGSLFLSNGTVIGQMAEVTGWLLLEDVNMTLSADSTTDTVIRVYEDGYFQVGAGTELNVVSGQTNIGSICGCATFVIDGGIVRFGTSTENPGGDFARVIVGGNGDMGNLYLFDDGEMVIGNPDSGADSYGSLRVGLGEYSEGLFVQAGGYLNMRHAGSFSIGQDGAYGAWMMSGGVADLGTDRVLFFHIGRGENGDGAMWLSGDGVVNFGLADPGEALNWGQIWVASLHESAIGEIYQLEESVLNIRGELFLGGAGQGIYTMYDCSELNFLATPSNTNTALVVGFENQGGQGIFYQEGGTVNFAQGVRMGIGTDSSYSLGDGTLNIGGENAIHGSGVFNLDGGTLRVVHEDLTTSIDVLVTQGFTASTIDTNGFDATFTKGIIGYGAIVKTGEGALNAPSIVVDELEVQEGQVNVSLLGVPVLLLTGGELNADTIELDDASQSVIENAHLHVATSITANDGVLILGQNSVLGGNATIQPEVYVSAFAAIAPGNSAGILTFEDGVYFDGGSIYSWFLGANSDIDPGVNFDQIVVTGGDLVFADCSAVDLNFGDDVDFSDSFWGEDRLFAISSFLSPGELFFGDVDLIGDTSYLPFGAFSLVAMEDGVYLEWTAVPEPQVYALLAGVAALLLAWHRKRRLS